MANSFEEYNALVDTFNKKYGTNFSFLEYDKEQRRFDNFSDNFLKGPVNGVSNEDNVYRKEFLKLYKQYMESMILGYSETFFTTPDYTYFINDFEDLMDVYRSYCSDEKRKAPSKLGGWKKGNDIIEAMEGKANELTDGFSNKNDYVRNEYLAGRMPLRKMRADLEKIKNSNYYTENELGRIVNYHNAIEKIVQGHSVWSYINLFRLGRTLAENREYKALNEFIESSVNKSYVTYDLALTVAKSSFSLETIKNTVQSNSFKINRLVDNTLKANNDVTEIKANANNNVIDDKNVDIASSVSAQGVEGLFADDDFMEDFYDAILVETDKVDSLVQGQKNQTKLYFDMFILNNAKPKITAFCANYDAADTSEKKEELVKQYSIEMFTYICDQIGTFGIKNQKDCVVVGQKITDVILHKLTPFAFKDEKIAKYGDKYGVKDNSLLESIAEAKGYGDTKEEFIESIKQDLGMVESKKEAIPELKIDIEAKENNDKASPVIEEQIKEVTELNNVK